MTTPQFRARTKDVTRRLGWAHLKPGDRLMGCEKCMGRRPGQPLVRLGEIEVMSARRERLWKLLTDPAYGRQECRREGFPEMTPEAFVAFFCQGHGDCQPSEIVTRIEFRYL